VTADELDDHIRQLCAQKGLMFPPWQVTPWEADDDGPCPWPSAEMAVSWSKAQKLRERLIAELEAAGLEY
jgi:hypothetical protein